MSRAVWRRIPHTLTSRVPSISKAIGWRSGMERLGGVCWNCCAGLADSCGVAGCPSLASFARLGLLSLNPCSSLAQKIQNGTILVSKRAFPPIVRHHCPQVSLKGIQKDIHENFTALCKKNQPQPPNPALQPHRPRRGPVQGPSPDRQPVLFFPRPHPSKQKTDRQPLGRRRQSQARTDASPSPHPLPARPPNPQLPTPPPQPTPP